MLTGEPVAPEHPGLSTLLSAAAAPPFAEELADERAAVARFTHAYTGAAATTMPVGRRRAWVPLSTRTIAVKFAAGIAVFVTGGTAFAAAAGNLPAGLQRHAHNVFSSLGVPAPDSDVRPRGTPTRGVASSARPSGFPTASAGGAAPAPTDSGVLGLCQAWEAAQKNPHGKAMTPQLRRALAAAADGESAVAGFCAKILAEHDSRSSPGTGPSPHPSAPTPTPSHPGGDDANGRDKAHSHSTPSPRH